MILTPSRKFAHAHIAPSRDKHRRFFKGLPMCVPSDREPRLDRRHRRRHGCIIMRIVEHRSVQRASDRYADPKLTVRSNPPVRMVYAFGKSGKLPGQTEEITAVAARRPERSAPSMKPKK